MQLCWKDNAIIRTTQSDMERRTTPNYVGCFKKKKKSWLHYMSKVPFRYSLFSEVQRTADDPNCTLKLTIKKEDNRS